MKAALRTLLVLVLAACELPTTTTSSQAAQPQTRETETVGEALCLLGYAAIPLRRATGSGHHLIEATLNGRAALFVVDTGANVSVVDADYAPAFGLADQGVARSGVQIGGPVTARQVPIESLSLGGVRVRQNRMIVAELGQAFDVLRPLAGGDVHGLIGQDVLNEHRAVIDVRGAILYLMEEARDPAPGPPERCRNL